MIPPLKIKCKKQQYRKDGTCALFEAKHECLTYNCIYYDGENNVKK